VYFLENFRIISTFLFQLNSIKINLKKNTQVPTKVPKEVFIQKLPKIFEIQFAILSLQDARLGKSHGLRDRQL
jgi:hypothetical protein